VSSARTEARGELSAAEYAAIVEFSDDAIISKDSTGKITSWNAGADRVYGYSAEEAIGQPISILIPPHRRGEERQILDRVLAGERIDHYETERVTKDGQLRIVSLSVSPIFGSGGDVVKASVIARDITARHRSLTLASRLQTLTTALSNEITPARTVDVLLEQAVAGLGAAAGAVGLVAPGADVIELAGSIGHSGTGISDWDRFPLSADVPMALAIRDNEAVWTTSAEELIARFPGVGDSAVRFASLAVIPLAVGGVPFGAVSLSFSDRHSFDDEERAFLASAGQQAAHTLSRARLFEVERELARRLSFVAEASELLAQSLDPEEALGRLAELAVGTICDWCGVDLVDDEGRLRNVAVAHTDPARVALAEELRERYPVDESADTGVPRVIRTGESELSAEITDEMVVASARDDRHLELMRDLGLVSVMIVPLQARGRTLGALSLVAAESGRVFGQADLALAEDLARRAALAIDNSMLFRREHEAAVILQRSLLPASLPMVDGLEFAARYEPAAPGIEVGGDWYEVVIRPDGTVGLTIGDVAGRGIRAASVMGRLRPALRAFVSDGHPPDEAIRRLDEQIKAMERPELTTVFHLQYDPATEVGEYVRAGHPPALVRHPDGRIEELRGGGSPPVGILKDVEFPVHRFELEPGCLLLLYTDGLIERRGDSLIRALERLKGHLAAFAGTAEATLDHLATTYTAEAVPDDVAMLAMLVGDAPDAII
jgi:PAS domain S-box-containing protein